MKRSLIVGLLLPWFPLFGQNTDKATYNQYISFVQRLEVSDTSGLHQLQTLLAASDSHLLLRLGLEAHLSNASGDYDKALQQFGQLLLLSDSLPDIWLGRAIAYGRSGQFDKAVDDLNHLETMQGASPHLLKLRGLALVEMAEFASAATDFEKALALEPADTELLYLSALVNYKTDKLKRALDPIGLALKLDSLNPQYHYLRGSIYLELDQFKQANADYNRALALRPGFADALTMKGYLFYLTGELQQAIATLKLAVEADAGFALPWFYTGLCQTELELPADALRSFDKATRLGYDDGDLFHYRGLAYIQLRRFDDACQAWKEAVLRGYTLSKALSRRYCQ